MSNHNWKNNTKAELALAVEARKAGNEGRARVCARRAAGYVIGEYLQREGIDISSESALDRLRYLDSDPNAPAIARKMANHFLVHLTPEHKLPIDADLIAEVELLARDLLSEELN
jgi:hypothetical protein